MRLLVRVVRTCGSTRLAKDVVLPIPPAIGMHLALDELEPLRIVTITLIPHRDAPGAYGPSVHVFLEDEATTTTAAAHAAGWWREDDPLRIT